MTTEGSGVAPGGLRAVLIATVAAGAVGYVIQGLVAKAIPASDYLGFSVFWSTLYLLIAALSGLQQESTRAARPVEDGQQPSRISTFGALTATVVALVVVGTAPLWAAQVFSTHPWPYVGLLAVGVVAYTGVALLSGIFYGLYLWRGVAGMTIVDAVLRLLLVGGALLGGASPWLLAAAVVAPFPLTLCLLWWALRSRVAGRYRLDVTPQELAWNALRAVGGSISTGLLTSGFPLMIKASSAADPASVVGALVFVITLTRAPLVVPALALQSYLSVRFRDQGDGVRRTLVRLVLAVLAVSVVAAGAAWLVEPWLLRTIWGDEYVVSAPMCAGIVLTAGLTAALCVTGSATLATNRHGTYLAGWVVAALVSITALALPLPVELRVLASMALGPVCGILVHSWGVTRPATAR